MDTRLLGILCIAGSVIWVLAALLGLAFGAPESSDDIPNLFWAIGAVAGLVGMIQGNAVGSNPAVRAVAFVPIIALVAMIVTGIARLFDATVPHYDSLYFGLLAGMILVSILTIAAKTWLGWRRFVPLFVLVMFFFISVAVAGDNSPFPGSWLGPVVMAAPWALLGYVVATAEPAPAQAQSATA